MIFKTPFRLALKICFGWSVGTTLLVFFVGAWAQDIGVNVVNPMRGDENYRLSIVAQLVANGIESVRVEESEGEPAWLYLKRLSDAKLKILIIAHPAYVKGAAVRTKSRTDAPQMWATHGLSQIDLAATSLKIKALFENLDKYGIRLSAVEYGNEINWAAFNSDLPLSGKLSPYTEKDLLGPVPDQGTASDPDLVNVRAGLNLYVEAVKLVKSYRDKSQLNASASIISAGLVPTSDTDAGGPDKGQSISELATINYLMAKGVGEYIDAIGIHVYPWISASSADRIGRLKNVDLAACGAKASGKPCWITELGYSDRSECDSKEDPNLLLAINDASKLLRQYTLQGDLIGVSIFSWNSDPWEHVDDRFAIYRCGAITKYGARALSSIGK